MVSIGSFAFRDNQLTNISIPDSVTFIGNGAFLNNQLTSINIGNGVTTLGEIYRGESAGMLANYGAFGENQLTNIVIPNNVIVIGDNAFSKNQLTNINIPDSVTTIGHYAFSNNQLTGVTIPNSVTYIGTSFNYNPLVRFTIGANVTMYTGSTYGGIGIADAYTNGGKRAGTYTRPNTTSRTWTWQSVPSLNTQVSEDTGIVTRPDNTKRVVTLDTTRLKWSQQLGKYEVLRLRSEPSTNGNILAELSRGDEVTILETGNTYTDADGLKGNWVKVRYGSIIGWCFSGYLDIP